MKVALLSGGVGGARCALALDTWRRTVDADLDLTVVVNVGDDFTHLGLRISPDLDSVTYHLGGLADRERGWGRAGDSQRIMMQVERHLPEAAWFHLGDLDLAHSLIRSELLASGLALSDVARRFADDFGIAARIIPVTDDPSPTAVDLPDGRSVGFQEWWVRDRAEPLPLGFRFPAAGSAAPAPGAVEAVRDADLVVIAPSNPIVSIAPILAIPGLREAMRETGAPVAGISPIIGGRPVRGWADRCLAAAGVECSARGVRDFYGHRGSGGLLDGWLLDEVDAADCARADAAGGSAGSAGPCAKGAVPTAAAPLLFSGTPDDNRAVAALFRLAGLAETAKNEPMA